MSNHKKAVEAKNKGNQFFINKQYHDAIKWYTKAIEYESNDSAFFSNRCAAYMGLNKFDEALSDAESCIRLKPDWVKGYYRKGMALVALYRYEEAARAFKKGLEVDPGNADLKDKLKEAEREAQYAPKRFDEDGVSTEFPAITV